MHDLETIESPTGWAVEVATPQGRQRWPIWSMSFAASGRALVVDDVFVPSGVMCVSLDDEAQRVGAAVLRFVECSVTADSERLVH